MLRTQKDLRQKFNEGNPNESISKMEEVSNHFTEVVNNIIYPQRNDSILLAKIDSLRIELDSLKEYIQTNDSLQKHNTDTTAAKDVR